MSKDDLITDIGYAILSDPAYMNGDWDGISIVINVEPGHTSMNGYVYSGDDWEGSLPDENGDDLINLAADLQDVMAAEVGKRWVQALVQISRPGPEIDVQFEYDDPARWSIGGGKGNVEGYAMSLRPGAR